MNNTRIHVDYQRDEMFQKLNFQQYALFWAAAAATAAFSPLLFFLPSSLFPVFSPFNAPFSCYCFSIMKINDEEINGQGDKWVLI